MDQQQVAFFVDRYSRMSDEELSYLLVTRGDSLAEEARHALDTVIRGRDPSVFHRELQATASDVTGQVKHVQQEAERQAREARRLRFGLRVICAILIIVGLLGAMVGDSTSWLSVSAVGVALFVFTEIRRLLGRLVAAIFRMN